MVHLIAPVAPHNSHFPAFNRSIRLVRQAYIIRLGCLSISDCLVGTLRLNPSWYSVRSFSLPFLSLNLTVNSPLFVFPSKITGTRERYLWGKGFIHTVFEYVFGTIAAHSSYSQVNSSLQNLLSCYYSGRGFQGRH